MKHLGETEWMGNFSLPEDEIDVWDAEALAATSEAPTPTGDRSWPAS